MSREFLENKMQQARDGLVRLENAMEVSLYEGMQAMRQLVTDVRIHLWSGNSAISRFQFNSQSIYYLLTRASDVLKNHSLSNRERVEEIWNGITESLTQVEDRNKATERLEKFLTEWRETCRLQEHDRQRFENQIREDFKRGFDQQHSDIEDLFSQLREYFQGLRRKLEATQRDVSNAELPGTIAGGGAVGVCAGIGATAYAASYIAAAVSPAAPVTLPFVVINAVGSAFAASTGTAGIVASLTAATGTSYGGRKVAQKLITG